MKIFLLFYMCHFAMGLTHCYKTTVFLHLYLVIGQSLYWPREFEVINISHWNFEHIDRKQHDAEIVTRKLAVRGTASIAAPELEYCDQYLKQIRLFAVKLQRKKRFQHFCVLDLYLWPRPKCRGATEELTRNILVFIWSKLDHFVWRKMVQFTSNED